MTPVIVSYTFHLKHITNIYHVIKSCQQNYFNYYVVYHSLSNKFSNTVYLVVSNFPTL